MSAVLAGIVRGLAFDLRPVPKGWYWLLACLVSCGLWLVILYAVAGAIYGRW